MSDIYAVSISASQGVGGVVMRAELLHSDEGRTTSASLEWPEIPAINAAGNSAEWLYSVLSRVLMEYDAHVVTTARTKPAQDLKVVLQREA